MCPPGWSGSGSAIILDRENVAFVFAPGDPLHRPDGHGGTFPVTPFDVFAVYDHGGDYGAATAALEQGEFDV